MTAPELIDAEIKRLDGIKATRGALWEDEQERRDVFGMVRQWLADDKAEAERIELEALEAEETERREAELNDPNYSTRQLFKGLKIKVPEKGKTR